MPMIGTMHYLPLGMVAAVALALSACGGGSGGPVADASRITPEGVQLDYTATARARHSYTPYATKSAGYNWSWGPVRQTYIGGDLEPRENLRHVSSHNGIRYYIGATRDGVGVDRLRNYERDLLSRNGRFRPFRTPPRLYFDSDLVNPDNLGIALLLITSIDILNDALPPEYQIRVMGTRDGATVRPGEIMVSLESAASIRSTCGSTAVACARNNSAGRYTVSAVLRLPDDLDTSEHNHTRSIILHELLHALGIQGHVDSIEFPDSIMGTAGEYIPNPGYVINRIDREALQIMYMSQRSDLYNDWGEWSDTSFHLVARTDDDALSFGAALFNGLPQPWVRGTTPDMDLADNRRLSGTATWTGALLGFSGPSPIAGNAELEVRLATLGDSNSEQDLRFRDIYFMNRYESRDFSSSSEFWFDTRNIDYKVNVYKNWFENVRGEGYEQGHVAGAFVGRKHEHMGGTVKRTDMVASFGGSR